VNSSQVAISTEGYVNGSLVNQTVVQQVNPFYGWNNTCTGCVLKRMLSLAQLQNQQNFADGSYWQTNGGQPTANWSSGQIGQGAGINCTPGPNCYYRYYSAGATNVAGFQSYPADSSKVITYPGSGYAQEDDGISLHY